MPNVGYRHTPEARAKMSAALRGKKLSPAHIANRTVAQQGKKRSEETRHKISVALTGKKQSMEHTMHCAEGHRGRHRSDEAKAKISATLKMDIRRRGENNPNWKGGISFEPYCPKFNRDLKKRIREFFQNKCLLCGITAEDNTRQLSCHHVNYNKNACCDGKPIHFAALCSTCHSKTGGGERPRWEEIFHRIIDEMYDGRSYFTKEEWREICNNE